MIAWFRNLFFCISGLVSQDRTNMSQQDEQVWAKHVFLGACLKTWWAKYQDIAHCLETFEDKSQSQFLERQVSRQQILYWYIGLGIET